MLDKEKCIDVISKKTGGSKENSEKVLENIIQNITGALKDGKIVKISDFGVFKVMPSEKRQKENDLLLGENTIQFKAAKYLDDKVNQIDIVESLLNKGKLTNDEAKILNRIFINSKEKKDEFNDVAEENLIFLEVKDIAVSTGFEIKDVERLVNKLIDKKILNTMVYYGQADSVYLRANYRKYL